MTCLSEISVYGVVRVMLKFPNRGVECITRVRVGKIRSDFLREHGSQQQFARTRWEFRIQ